LEGTGVSMSSSTEDLQMLRFIKTFRKIKDPDTRRMIVTFVEEELRKEEAKRKQ
jgi:hypothetical protein